MPPQAGRGGRPSLAVGRRAQIIDAFVGLVADRGLEGVTLDDVARAAGLQRSIVRHYVGNRSDLLHAAVDLLVDRYRSSLRAAVGPHPTVGALLDHLFGPAWTAGQAGEDRALRVLFEEALRAEPMRARVRGAYDLLLDEVAAAVHRERPTAAADRVRDAAYQIVCLAEANVDLQLLGFPPERGAAARALAESLATAVT